MMNINNLFPPDAPQGAAGSSVGCMGQYDDFLMICGQAASPAILAYAGATPGHKGRKRACWLSIEATLKKSKRKWFNIK